MKSAFCELIGTAGPMRACDPEPAIAASMSCDPPLPVTSMAQRTPSGATFSAVTCLPGSPVVATSMAAPLRPGTSQT